MCINTNMGVQSATIPTTPAGETDSSKGVVLTDICNGECAPNSAGHEPNVDSVLNNGALLSNGVRGTAPFATPCVTVSVSPNLTQILLPTNQNLTNPQDSSKGTAIEERLYNLIQSMVTRLEDLIEKILRGISTKPTLTTESAATPESPASGSANNNAESSTSAAANTTNETKPGSDKVETLPFKKKLSELFSDQKELSETDLRNGIVTYQLYQKSPTLEPLYKKAYDVALAAGKSSTEAVKQALQDLAKAGEITADEAKWVFSLSARAAQIDENLEYLRTTVGTGDNFKLENALQIAEVNLASIQGGRIKVPTLQLS